MNYSIVLLVVPVLLPLVSLGLTQSARGQSNRNLGHGHEPENLFVEPVASCPALGSTIQHRATLHECARNATNGDHRAERQRVLVTGGAGFLGSHLVDSLMLEGREVYVMDNFHTGRMENIRHWVDHENFHLIEDDVVNFAAGQLQGGHVDQIYHLASPASPVHYMADPLKTIRTVTLGSMKVLEYARERGIRVLLASTSEVYGDPLVHPQPETYWGNVNPAGPRSCYDESKRLSETLASTYRTQFNVSVCVARIFNTYGPRMHPSDGRVVSNFISQFVNRKPITVYGTGNQTRSFQYVTDLVSGMRRLMVSNMTSTVNLGNPHEITINSLAARIRQAMPNSTSPVVHLDLPVDDPQQRKPDIRKAMMLLGWKPSVPLELGLVKTIKYFQNELMC